MENSLKLYEISNAFKDIEEKLEDDKSLEEYLDAIKMDLVEKVDSIVMYRRSLELTADAIQSEVDRLTHLKKIYDRRSESLKSYLSYNLQKVGKDKLETEKAILSFRKSTSTEIIDATLVPDEYKTIKTTESIDKIAIKKAIQSGLYVAGAVLSENRSLQIK